MEGLNRSAFKLAQQELADKQRYKFIQTQEDGIGWQHAYSGHNIRGVDSGCKYVRAALNAEFGILPPSSRVRGLTGYFYVIVRDADNESRRSPTMTHGEALRLYELMTDNITVARLTELGFVNHLGL